MIERWTGSSEMEELLAFFPSEEDSLLYTILLPLLHRLSALSLLTKH
jgi:hypothetical protein